MGINIQVDPKILLLHATLNQSCHDEYYIDALTTSPYYSSMKCLKNDNK